MVLGGKVEELKPEGGKGVAEEGFGRGRVE